MAKLAIRIVPDPILKNVADPVERVDEEVRRLMDDMLETMYAAPGIGLAAPQVGISRRVIVLDCAGEEEAAQPLRMANPEVLWTAGEREVREEGCLSLPDLYADVSRPRAVRLRYLDEAGEAQELEAEGLLATVVQHEIDHLNGVLFTDHLSALKRNMMLRKHLKQRQRKPAKSQQSATA